MAWPPVNHQDVTDAVTTLRAAPPAHVHPVTDLTATGTRSSTTFLRGDGIWATPAGGTSTTPGANMANESVAGIATTNTGATNRANYNTWTSANPGVPIFIRAGTYDFDGTVSPKGSIYGAGPGVTVLRFPAQATGSIYVSNVNDITNADYEIRCTSATGPGTQGANSSSSNHLTYDHVDRFLTRNVFCNGGANIGMMHLYARYGTVIGNKVQGTWRDGIHMTIGCDRIAVVGNNVWNTGDDCIAVVAYTASVTNVNRIAISGNVVSNQLARGITVLNAVDVTVAGNTVNSVASHGVIVGSEGDPVTDTWGSYNVTVVGNTINDPAGCGVFVSGKHDNVNVKSNTINSPTQSGVQVNGGKVRVQDNTIFEPTSQGIFMTVGGTSMDKSVIMGNVIVRAGSRGVYVQGSNTNRLTINNNVVQECNNNGGSVNQAILVEGGTGHMVCNNRLDSFGSTVTNYTVNLSNVTNALCTNNVATNATGAYLASGTTSGVTTANNVLL